MGAKKRLRQKDLGGKRGICKDWGRYPEIFIGVALIVGGIIFSLLISSNNRQVGVDILVLAEAIQKDEILKPSHLTTAQVSTNDSVKLALTDSTATLIGKRALVNLPARAPLLSDYFSTSLSIPKGFVVSTLQLRVGQYPIPHLRTGDFVDIVSTSSTSKSQSLSSLLGIEVHSVSTLDKGSLLAMLLIPDRLEEEFAHLASDGNIRLFLNPTL